MWAEQPRPDVRGREEETSGNQVPHREGAGLARSEGEKAQGKRERARLFAEIIYWAATWDSAPAVLGLGDM